MNLETPKNYDKKSNYTSPIGLLKNYNTINSAMGNNSYEEEFFRIKAQRLENQLEQVREQNNILKQKLNQSNITIQVLKEKLYSIQNNAFERADRILSHRTVPTFGVESKYIGNLPSDSKYFSQTSANQKSQRSAYNSEIQRLLKQNRILKNDYEFEMNKLRDENKKLNRRIMQLESDLLSKPNKGQAEIQEKNRIAKIEERNAKLEKSISQLRKDHEDMYKERRKWQQKISILEENNRALRRQNEQLKLAKLSKSRVDANLKDLQHQLQQNKRQHRQEVESLQSEIGTLRSKQRQFINKPLENSRRQNSRTPPKINQIINNPQLQQNQSSKTSNEAELLKRRIAQYQQALTEKDEQIKNILIKLKPLMEKNRDKDNKNEKELASGDPKRASLSILQVFLKKYKINVF